MPNGVTIMVGKPTDVMIDVKAENGFWLKSYTVGGTNVKTRAGRLWNNLETRTQGKHKDSCYDTAINGFTDFNQFAEWCQSQHGYMNKDDNGYFWQLDKDILGQGHKVYCPDVCVFVPNKVNSILIEQNNSSGLPLGVTPSGNGQRYVAKGRDLAGIKRHIGTFDDPEDAHWAWYEYKREVIKMVLRKYELGSKVVNALKSQWNIR